MAFWQMMAGYAALTALAVVLTLAFVAWLFCALIAIGRMRERTLWRVVSAFAFGPFTLGDVLAHRG
jgi:hypothetical protein